MYNGKGTILILPANMAASDRSVTTPEKCVKTDNDCSQSK